MKNFWVVLNSGLVALGLLGGYKSMASDRLNHTNPDAIACLSILAVMPLFAVLSVGYSIRRWNPAQLPRPSWSRNPLDWWRDPLQSMFVTTCMTAAMAIGAVVQHPRPSDRLASGPLAFTAASRSACSQDKFWRTESIVNASLLTELLAYGTSSSAREKCGPTRMAPKSRRSLVSTL